MKIILKQNLRTPNGLLKTGDEIVIACDDNNLPLDNFWRNRLKDSEIDNAIEIVKENEIVKTKTKK
jgi:hypothetical protein